MFEPFTGLLSIITGVAGSITTAIVNYKMKRLELKDKQNERRFRIRLLEKETEAMVKEAEVNLKVTRAEYEGKEALVEAEGWKETLKKQDKAMFHSQYMKYLMESDSRLAHICAYILMVLFGFIDVVKASIRPGIAIYEGAIVTWFSFKAYEIAGGLKNIITPDQASEIFMLILTALLQMMFISWGWWYADRRIAKDFVKRLAEKGWIK